MTGDEALRARHRERLFEVLPEHFERLTWPAERLRAERDARLRDIIAHAQRHSRWHRERLTGVNAERLTADQLATLPPMTKRDLMEHFEAIVTDPRLTRDLVEQHLGGLIGDAYLLDEYHVCASGGSSGVRGVFVYDFEGWVTAFASFIRFSFAIAPDMLSDALPRRAMVAADKASHMTSAFLQSFPPPGEVKRLSAAWPLERLVAELNAFQPAVLMGYASMLQQLAREAAAGRLRIAPRLVSSSSEPLLPEIRATITAAWPVPLLNGFGSTEGLMGGSCRAGRGLHLSDDLFVIEPVDTNGAPVPAGARAAKLYLTSLYNRVQPLIRYELTDEVVVLDEPCPCGAALLRIDDIEGRLDDRFEYPGGPTIHPFTYRSLLGRERAIVEYQVRQTARGADVAVRADGELDTTRLAEALAAAVRAAGLADPVVTVTVVDEIPRQAIGKLRRFIPLP